MKTKILTLLCGFILLTSCSGDDDDNGNSQGGSSTTTQANVNANPSAIAAYTRLEMPHINGGANDTVLIHRTSGDVINYITEWDYARKTQRWSCYVLDADYLKQNTTRYTSDTNQYPQDELIPASMQWSSDPYYSNGQRFDHGHICPSADRLYSYTANYQTFFLTNMQPQFNAFNAGLWAKMEAKVRTIATNCDTLYVCKGGTIDTGTYSGYNKIYRTLDNGLIVPRYFFMALLRVKNGAYNAIALWTDQVSNVNDTGSSLSRYAISIDELEERTGIDFFCNLPDDTENNVEKNYATSIWSLN